MSEIFEALIKAQREADARRARNPDSDAPAGPAPPAPVVAPAPVAAPASQRARSGRWRWWPRTVSRNGHDLRPPLFVPNAETIIGEQFRVLRTHIESNGPQAIMVTSALAQEGKTLCAANLAVALALRVGAQVVLVDADLRHPSAGAYFGLRDAPGLVDCLQGTAQWRDCLATTPYAGLRVLPAGRRTDRAPELLAAEGMRALAAELKVQFPEHYLLFDTPPLLITADPMVLARHMDRFVLVVRAGVTPRAAVLKAVETLGADRLLGVIFNDATDSVSDYYYYAYGRYGHGDGGAR